MAKSQIKAGGPTRGRQRKTKMGMGSGKLVVKARSGGKLRPKATKQSQQAS